MMVGLVAGTAMAGSPGAISPLEDFVLADNPQGLGFKNQSALADKLYKQDSKIWGRKSLASQVSKHFSFALPLSDKFKDSLRAITQRNLKDNLQKAIDQHEEEHQRRNNPVRYIRVRYETSKHLFFLGLEPISANLGSVPDTLIDLLKFSFQEIVTGNLSVTMGVPSREIAEGIWVAISGLAEERAKTNPEQGTVAELLAIADQKLVLLSLPRHMCVHTTFVFDPDLPTGVGYIWYMPWDWRSPAKMPPAVLEAWKQEFLKPLLDRRVDGQTISPVART